MKKFLLTLLGFGACAIASKAQVYIPVYDDVVFYDGYRLADFPEDMETPDGVLRHYTYLCSTRLTDEQLDKVGDILDLSVSVRALCDNYDRIGNVNLALVPKGSETYSLDEVSRIEIGRFITPFMNKNRKPDTVPYYYKMDYMSLILRDANLREKYDLWLEFELFGVPYAAQQQVRGCVNHQDVFAGTLEFVTNDPAPKTNNNVLVPIVMKTPEYRPHNLNNYNELATDELGKTIKTWKFEVPEDVADAQIVLVTSNHGANSGGEEYNRRMHYVNYDGETVLIYKPGRTSCEPFRIYNTQGNGIYSFVEKSDEQWQSFSNWCPGDVIDNRIIHLGPVTAGEHSIQISVPDAVFADKQGDIPVSMFFQGVKEGTLPVSGVAPVYADEWPEVTVTVKGGILSINASEDFVDIEIYDASGALALKQRGAANINVAGLGHGVFFVTTTFDDGRSITTKKVF